MIGDQNVFARREPWNDGVQLCFIVGRTAAHHAIVPNFRATETLEEGALFPDSAILRLENTLAQKLMDELWNCGIRPSEGTGSAGALAATQAHLKDMQRLVFELVIPPRVSIEGMTRLHPRDPS